jgi:hypothetical protein
LLGERPVFDSPFDKLMEMTRRLVLVGLFVLIERGSIVQLIVGTVFCAIYLCVSALPACSTC